MGISPAKRMKAVRDLVALTREAFCDVVGMPYTRVANLENDRARLSVEDLAELITVFPEFTTYLIFGNSLDVDGLANSENELVKAAAFRIKSGVIPSGYGLEEVIVNGSKD